MLLSYRSKILLTFFLMIIIIVMLLLAAEGVMRARHYIKYGTVTVINDLYYDQNSGLNIPRPNMETGTISINSLGFRGPEIEVPKPVNRIRIGFIGASTTYCAEVSSNKHVWTDIVTSELESHYLNQSFDYINGGVPGYSTETSLINLEKRVMPLNPDIVVIYHATNDLSGETRKLAEKSEIKRSNLQKEESWIGKYSLLWHLVEKNLKLINLQQSIADESEMLSFNPQEMGEEFRLNLEKLVDLAYREGAQLVALVTFSVHLRDRMTIDQQNAAMISARYYMPYITTNDYLSSFKRYNQIIKEVAEKKRALIITNENFIPGDPQHFADSVHFTDLGSQMQAKRVADGLVNSHKLDQIINNR